MDRFNGILAAGMIAMIAGSHASAEKLDALDVRQVKVGGEIGRRIDATVTGNLLAVDLDKDFLAPFLERNRTDGYVGLGKTLDAMARLAAYSGDERLVERKRQLVEKLLASQEPDGYLGFMRPESRIGQLWDVHEMAYLVLGLTSDHRFCGEEASLAAARKLADYLVARLSAEPRPAVGPDDLSSVMGTTGLDETFLYLSEQTGDPRYRDFVVNVRRLPEWRMPLVLGRWGKVEGHAYAYLAECLAQLRLNALQPDPGLRETSAGVLDLLLRGDGLVVTGTCGDHECWHNTQSGTTNLGETCTTAYMLRWYDELLRQTGDPAYGDLMERAVHNALFGAQSPDGRRIRYYTPFEAPRTYYVADTYCCPGNFRRIMAELPSMIYYRRPDGVYVNLYTPSTAQLELEQGVKVTLRQETDYPASGRVKLHIEPSAPATFAVYFRIPRWAETYTGRFNGENDSTTTRHEATVSVRREWKAGDTLEIEFPIEARLVKGRRTQEGRVALLHGPQVLAYNPERNPDWKDIDPRLMTLDPASIEGPIPDDSVHPGGIAYRVAAWEPGVFYPHAPTRTVLLTEYADPGATWTYFHAPNPQDDRFVDDELIGRLPATAAE